MEQFLEGMGFPCRAECPSKETLQHKLGGQQRRRAGGAPLSASLPLLSQQELAGGAC